MGPFVLNHSLEKYDALAPPPPPADDEDVPAPPLRAAPEADEDAEPPPGAGTCLKFLGTMAGPAGGSLGIFST